MKIIYQDNSGRNWDTEAECVAAELDDRMIVELRQLVLDSIGNDDLSAVDVAQFINNRRNDIMYILNQEHPTTEDIVSYNSRSYKMVPEVNGCRGCTFDEGDSVCSVIGDLPSRKCIQHNIIWIAV